MNQEEPVVYPFMPNSVPDIKNEMLKEIGASNVMDLYVDIPEKLRFKGQLDLPEAILSEQALERHVKNILNKNKSCDETLNFLGAGCYQHYVPAVCDEVIGRGEFLTCYAGMSYTDTGRWQALFEYQSLIADLVGLDITGMPAFDPSAAGGTAVRMAARITGRSEILIPESINPQQLSQMKTYCKTSEIKIFKTVKFDRESGTLDLNDLKGKLSSKTAAVYLENPNYFGVIEIQAKNIADLAHAQGALLISSVNAISLGIIAPPGEYDADIAIGNTQPLGVHMNCGGGVTGFLAVNDIPEHINEYPHLLVTILDTVDGDDYSFHPFGVPERLSYMGRENGKEYTGTNNGLWAIANAVYLALMGPKGMQQIGRTNIENAAYARKLLSEIPNVQISFNGAHFNEFVVNFDKTGKNVDDINKSLLNHNIFGGKDLSKDFPELGNSALYCVTEIHCPNDIQKLVDALKEEL